jgi:uncharacterized membrane protein YoaK (UPF0700 family)
MPDTTPPPRGTVTALFGLTFATGIIDAASILGPGRVFTANMTGNIVFLGFALAGRGATPIGSGLLALGAFLVGATIGGRLGASSATLGARRGLALEILALAAATGVATTRATYSTGVVVALMGFAMGLRNAVVRKLAVPDLTTTVLTLTLTGIAADSSLAGGTNPRWRRRVLAPLSMLGGALVGAWMLQFGWSLVIGAALGVEIASVAFLFRSADSGS